ncbi:hypothetical protein HPB48_022615 [Haemaphysalis longicornis]|uniref:Presenilin n=1 Tax=Haemaphysalis longicornis TaxID=44386 RepID=A0A9J6GUG5_HAELO|nr:hypothetical protein HPB48_022615 [Haemaphysalis longicornis]
MMGSGILLFSTGYYYFGRLLFYFNTPVDHVTCSFITWNIGMAGIAALYFDGPFMMQQSYLVYMSVLMALVLEESLPEWTSWVLLVLISIWDVFAVLCVVGPLRMLLETAKERNEPLFPALVFSTSSAWCYDIGERSASLTLVRDISSTFIANADGQNPVKAAVTQSSLPTSTAHADVQNLALAHDGEDDQDRDEKTHQPLPKNERVVEESRPASTLLENTDTETMFETTNGSRTSTDRRVEAPAMTCTAMSKQHMAVINAPNEAASLGEANGTNDTERQIPGAPSPRTVPQLNARGFQATRDSGGSYYGGRRGGGGGRGAWHDFGPAPRYIPEENASPFRGAGGSHYRRHETAVTSRCPHHEPAGEPQADQGMKMGLGDFIFYSVLVGKASRYGTAATVITCYVFIIMGIFLTLTLLVLLQKPLPALPLSISLGMMAYFFSVSLTEPFFEAVGSVAL